MTNLSSVLQRMRQQVADLMDVERVAQEKLVPTVHWQIQIPIVLPCRIHYKIDSFQ